jgi:hypothetical protein
MSKPFLTQKEKIYLRSMKNRGKKIPQYKLKDIFKSDYISPK